MELPETEYVPAAHDTAASVEPTPFRKVPAAAGWQPWPSPVVPGVDKQVYGMGGRLAAAVKGEAGASIDACTPRARRAHCCPRLATQLQPHLPGTGGTA